jgi:hypothetical protein
MALRYCDEKACMLSEGRAPSQKTEVQDKSSGNLMHRAPHCARSLVAAVNRRRRCLWTCIMCLCVFVCVSCLRYECVQAWWHPVSRVGS